jgi:hypothetical protein
MPVQSTTTPARRLAAALEPFVGQVYFSPECHAAYAALGFGGSPGRAGEVALPDGPAYFTSRGSVMGQVPGEVVAAAFAVFNPAAVVPSVTHGWTLTDAATVCRARDDGATAQLVRILGDEPAGLSRVTELLARACEPLRPEGRPLYSGLRSLADPPHPLGRAWRLGDLLREYRGDSHTAAWVSAGLDATEIGLLTELWLGLPLRTYVRTRAWSDADLDAATERLAARRWLDETGTGFSEAGRAARAEVEDATDRQVEPSVRALGDDLDELVDRLTAWSDTIRAAGGYLGRGAGDLARAR